MFAERSRKDTPIFTKLGMLTPRDQEDILETFVPARRLQKQKPHLRNAVLGSSPGENAFVA
jgi:hypothetical protein